MCFNCVDLRQIYARCVYFRGVRLVRSAGGVFKLDSIDMLIRGPVLFDLWLSKPVGSVLI